MSQWVLKQLNALAEPLLSAFQPWMLSYHYLIITQELNCL